jgi:cobalt/nickel transport system permease protein
MHISDGILSAPVWIGGYVVTTSIVACTIRKMKPKDIPKTAVMTSCFFVASLIHIPLGPTSVHLILNGLVGIILGKLAFVSIFVGLVLQALLFQHGGITTIGANSVMMGIPAIVSYKIFSFLRMRLPVGVSGAIAGASAILLATIILALLLVSTGEEFLGVAKYAIIAHLPVMLIEGIVSGFVVSFIMRVKPEILGKISFMPDFEILRILSSTINYFLFFLLAIFKINY